MNGGLSRLDRRLTTEKVELLPRAARVPPFETDPLGLYDSDREAKRFRKLRATPPTTVASSSTENGSGVPTGMPGMLIPAVVPNENVALVTDVPAVTPATERVNVPCWLIKGLWGPFPAIEPLALL